MLPDNSRLHKLTAFIYRLMAVFWGVVIILFIALFTLSKVAQTYHSRIVTPDTPDHWILSNVNVVTLNRDINVLESQDIVVQDGKISAVHPHDPHLHNVYVVDGAGKFVTPGLIDSHVHIEDSAYLGLALSHGVTTVRGMRGNQTQLLWRDEIEEGAWLGSRFIVASPIVSGVSGDPFHRQIITREQAEQLVTEFAEYRYDLIKLYATVDGEVFDQLTESAALYNLPIAKHAPYPAHNKSLQSLKHLQSLEHVEDIYAHYLDYAIANNEELTESLAELSELDVPIVTTLSVFDELTHISQYKNSYIQQIPLEYIGDAHRQLSWLFGVNRWLAASDSLAERNSKDFANLFLIVNALHKLGVPLILGSDSGALVGLTGRATHRELELLVASGLNAADALRTATINAAEMLGLEHELGLIQPGYIADFVVSNSNPLEDLSALVSPYAVSYRGQYLDQKTLGDLRVNAAQTLPVWLGYPMIMWHVLENYLWQFI